MPAKKKRTKASDMGLWDPLPESFIMDPDGDTVITLNNPSAPFEAGDNSAHDSLGSQPKTATPRTFLVSSRHLVLASPVFKRMLAGAAWSEASKVDGKFRIDSSEWDTQAFSIVLDLVHGRHRRTPKSVTLETLSRIALIVNYYEFHEAVEISCGSWVSKLVVSQPVPFEVQRNLYLWMFNAWVFGLEEIFKNTTKVAILRTTTDLETPDNLPIPLEIIGKPRQILLESQPNQSCHGLELGLELTISEPKIG